MKNNQFGEILNMPRTKNLKFFLSLLTAVLITWGLSMSFQSLLAAWTAPSGNPTTCATGDPGCDAPLNIGPLTQTKSGGLWINTNGISPYGLIVETGSVGIGTVNPPAKLSVVGTANNTIAYNGSTAFADISGGGTYAHLLIGGYNGTPSYGSWIQASNSVTALSMYLNPLGGNVIFGSGNVGIGATNPGAYKLYVDGTGYLNSAAWTYGSDKRLKENINYLSGGLAEIMELKPARFDYINGDKAQLGFIAQDVLKVIPEAVSEVDEATGMLGLKTDFIIPYMVNAIKELKAENDALKNRLEILEKE